MPVYNEEKYVEDSIESLLEQTYQDFELLIVDDCSEDRTAEILKKYDSRNRRIKVKFNEENRGWADAVNRGINLSRGGFIALMDAGDISHPKRLEKQLRFLKDNPYISIVGSFHNWIDREDNIISKYRFPTDPKRIEDKIFSFASITVCPSLLIREKVFKEIGLFNTNIPKAADYDFFIRSVINDFKIANLPEFLLSVRKRKRRGTVSKVRITFETMAKIRAKYLPYLFSLKNLSYTIVSGLTAKIPKKILKKILNFSIEEGSIRKSLLKI